MALLAYNLKTSPLTVTAGSHSITLPASLSDTRRGLAVNVSSWFRLLTSSQQTAIEALRASGEIDVIWSDQPEYETGSLYVRGAQVDAWRALELLGEGGSGGGATTLQRAYDNWSGTAPAIQETAGKPVSLYLDDCRAVPVEGFSLINPTEATAEFPVQGSPALRFAGAEYASSATRASEVYLSGGVESSLHDAYPGQAALLMVSVKRGGVEGDGAPLMAFGIGALGASTGGLVGLLPDTVMIGRLGVDGPGGNLNFSGGPGTGYAGGALGFAGGDSDTLAGGDISMRCGGGLTGGVLTLLAGDGTGGDGGSVLFKAGDAMSDVGNAGSMVVKGGDTNPSGTGVPGTLELAGGNEENLGVGAAVYLHGGTGPTGGASYVRGGQGGTTHGIAYVGDLYTASVHLGAAATPIYADGPVTVNPGTSPTTAVLLDIANCAHLHDTDAGLDSHSIVLTSRGYKSGTGLDYSCAYQLYAKNALALGYPEYAALAVGVSLDGGAFADTGIFFSLVGGLTLANDFEFSSARNQSIKVDDATAGVGKHLTIAAGKAFAGDGGNLILQAGAPNTGNSGIIQIGINASQTLAVAIGAGNTNIGFFGQTPAGVQHVHAVPALADIQAALVNLGLLIADL